MALFCRCRLHWTTGILVIICTVPVMIGLAVIVALSAMGLWSVLARCSLSVIAFALFSLCAFIASGPLAFAAQTNWEERLSLWRKLAASLLPLFHFSLAVLGACVPLSSVPDTRLRRALAFLEASHWVLSIATLVVCAYLTATYLVPHKRSLAAAIARRRGVRPVTSDMVPQHVDFLPSNLLPGGELGLTTVPGKKLSPAARDIVADLQVIKEVGKGADMLVCLLQEGELRLLGVPDLPDRATAAGLVFVHFPIHDKWIPQSMREFARTVDSLSRLLTESKRIVVDCCGGKGRSGLMVAAILLWLGAVDTVGEAVEVVKRARPGSLKNPIHRLYLHRFVGVFGHQFAGKVFASA